MVIDLIYLTVTLVKRKEKEQLSKKFLDLVQNLSKK
jgi:hypothetical protein